MEFPWIKSSLCRRTRDRLLDQLMPVLSDAPASGATRGDTAALRGRMAPPALPEEMERHLRSCAECRTLAAAAPAVTRWAPHWATPAPPPGLAQQTALRLLPFWTVRERAVNKQEVRMIWTSGLALAATSIVAVLLVLDGLFPVTPVAGQHPLVQVGFLVGATQLVGGGLLSLTLLALDTRRQRAAAQEASEGARRATDDPPAGTPPREVTRDEYRILGQAATAAGAFGTGCMAALLVMIFRLHPQRDNPIILGLAAFGAVAFLLMMVFVSLYVYYDAESRGMKGLWALLIFLFASLPGFLIYLLMRGPKLRACPVCRTTLQSDFVVCPTCQTKVGHGCPGCHRHIEPAWTTCPWCQADLNPGRRMIRPV